MTAIAGFLIFLAWANLAAWLIMAARVLRMRRLRLVVPHYLTAAAIVATVSASAGGAVASLGLAQALPRDLIASLAWGCWAAMLSAGLYAIAATIRAGRRGGPGTGPGPG